MAPRARRPTTRTYVAGLLLVVCGLGPSGCGGLTATSGDAAGSGGTGGRGTGEATGGSSGGSSAAGGSRCGAFADFVSREKVVVRFTNARADPVFVGSIGCEPWTPFTITDRSGLLRVWRLRTCEWSCQSLATTPYPGCTMDCGKGPAIQIDPGQSYDFGWDGRLADQVPMPIDCFMTPDAANPTCPQMVMAPASQYLFAGRAWVGGEPGPGAPLDVRAWLDYPAQRLVELRFE
jgi:hypothetical protein